MNKSRRKELARALDLAQEAQHIVETVRDEEEEYYDNMPEALQAGEKGDKASEAKDALDCAYDSLQEALDSIDEATQS